MKCRGMMQKTQQILEDEERINLQKKTPRKTITFLSWPSVIELDDIGCLEANDFFLPAFP